MTNSAEFYRRAYEAQQQGMSFEDATTIASTSIELDDTEGVNEFFERLDEQREYQELQDPPESQIRAERFEDRLAMFRNEY